MMDCNSNIKLSMQQKLSCAAWTNNKSDRAIIAYFPDTFNLENQNTGGGHRYFFLGGGGGGGGGF
jgi:hypothetical protein